MKKEIKYILFLVLALALTALVYFFTLNSKSQKDAKIALPNDTVTVDKPATTSVPEVLPPAVGEPIYTKSIKLELMNEAETIKMGMDSSLKIQVLARDKDGSILNYRIITPAHPILEKFGN